ncbi:hypothetical protein H6501_06125 [Candidatus Woesearchaeota archaeon]|nr:hypothetical protein [Nanoarchaeota archaeon]MCB9371151.1 hypothetical protein [Candidatus Woesearchaeota archaeon]USN43854.1 MAG: hypothetical protein H6500_05695 [Candidatus Woesearchaeota archaeon]
MEEIIEMEVDLDHREQLRRLHTATHILNHVAHKVLGNHVWQNGSNLKPELGSLDLTHYEIPSKAQLDEIERQINEVIFADRTVSVEEVDRDEAEKKYGFSLYQGGAIPMKSIRVVHIDESDIEACGGTHMQRTGGIGFFTIVDVQKIQDGVVRFLYKVHLHALSYVQERENLLLAASENLGVPSVQLAQASEKFFKEWKEQRKEIERLQGKVKVLLLEQLSVSKKNELKLEETDMALLQEIFAAALAKYSSFKLSSPLAILATKDREDIGKYKKKIDRGSFMLYLL